MQCHPTCPPSVTRTDGLGMMGDERPSLHGLLNPQSRHLCVCLPYVSTILISSVLGRRCFSYYQELLSAIFNISLRHPRSRTSRTPSRYKMATVTQTETKAPDATEVMLQRAEKAHTKPLWLQMARLNPPLPNPRCKPFLWRYADVRPSLLEAGKLVPEHQAERRVLMLVNPTRGMQSPD